MEVVGITINSSRIYYFDSNNIIIKNNDKVIVETEKGMQLGLVVNEKINISEDKLNLPLKKVIRIATEKDLIKNDKNILEAKKALKFCQTLVKNNKIDISIIAAEFSFDREQLTIQFVSDNRIDFRNIAKEMAAKYKTRIELRQVGARDKAKYIGGIGPCGRLLCCNKFLSSFDTISINMAKNQNISLNPTKINGLCGRLLCCLNYENEVYEEYKKGLPSVGTFVNYNDKKCKVIDVNILKRKYIIMTSDNDTVEITLDEKIK